MSTNQGHLGKYQLQERLGRSVVGDLWKAYDTQERRNVIIKIIPVNAQTSADFTPRFYHEAQILTSLRHPNIVPIQDFRMSQSGSEAYLIMEYVEGRSLADYLSSTTHVGKIPPPSEIVGLMAPIASALDYAHSRNVVHGALRPAAILLGKADEASPLPGEPKLTDFGLNSMQNPLALPLGEVSYISPEIAQGFAGSSRSDLYSLGVILYELCTGALPFHGDTASDVLMQSIHGMPMSPALINPQMPPALTAAIMRSLARDQAARYPSATALVTTVAKALNVGMPEGFGQAQPGRDESDPYRTVNTPSMSGIGSSWDTMNSPTYLSQPLSKESSVPPVVTGGYTPVLPPSPVISSSTPILPMTPTGSIPTMQAAGETFVPTQISQPSFPIPGQTGPSPTPPPPAQKRRSRGLTIALIAAVLLIVLAGTGIYLFFIRNASSTQAAIVGHAFFTSSGLLGSLSENKGITDELQINLQNLPNPQSGKSYYGWLLNDAQLSLPPVALGPLTLKNGQVTMTYIDPQHSNLLSNYGHFLVTEEDTNPPPVTPSIDTATWRYSAAFPTTPNPADTQNHFSLLDHLRHLLAQDPKLMKAGLGGGLDIWLFRNVTKIVEQAGSARDAQNQCTSDPNNPTCAFVRRALVRILDYLDGSAYVQAQGDVPAGTRLEIDPTIARVALLEFDRANQQPPGYLFHMGTHLRELADSPGVTTAQHNLAIRIGQAINNVQAWLEAVRTDAVKLMQMNNGQLSQPAALSILNDLLNQAKFALVGQFDPNTSTVREGVAEIHDFSQGLATFDVSPCTVTNGKNSCS